MAFERINPTDIKFEFESDKIQEIRRIFEDQSRLSLSEILFVLALIGFQNGAAHPLNAQSGGTEYTLSRTVYSRNSTLLDTYYGMLTILANTHREYDEVINDMAFCKNTDNEKRYVELVNVKTFYSYFLGGIVPLYNILNQLDRNSNDAVFSSLFEYVFEDDIIHEVYNELVILEDKEVMGV